MYVMALLSSVRAVVARTAGSRARMLRRTLCAPLFFSLIVSRHVAGRVRGGVSPPPPCPGGATGGFFGGGALAAAGAVALLMSWWLRRFGLAPPRRRVLSVRGPHPAVETRLHRDRFVGDDVARAHG